MLFQINLGYESNLMLLKHLTVKDKKFSFGQNNQIYGPLVFYERKVNNTTDLEFLQHGTFNDIGCRLGLIN